MRKPPKDSTQLTIEANPQAVPIQKDVKAPPKDRSWPTIDASPRAITMAIGALKEM